MKLENKSKSIITVMIVIAFFAMIIGPASADLSIAGYADLSKVADKDEYLVGEDIIYTLTVTNNDPDYDWVNVKIYDKLYGETEILVATVDIGKGGGVWTDTIQFTIAEANVDNGIIKNKLRIFGKDTQDGGKVVTASVEEWRPVRSITTNEVIVEVIGCLGVKFTPTWTGTVTYYEWIIDGVSEGVKSGTPSPITRTLSAGSHNVVLKVGNGEESSYSVDFEVTGVPAVIAKVNKECVENEGDDATFTADVTPYPNTQIASVKWTFSDGQYKDNDPSNNPVTRPIPAEGVIGSVAVKDEYGCIATDSVFIGPCTACTLRLYGTFGEGAGDDTVGNENWPYTDPEAPFYPQHDQSPRKDFVTFNPAMMDHNQAPPGSDDYYDELNYFLCEDNTQAERAMLKVFKTMWYEKEWFKDSNKNNDWDVVVLRNGEPEVWTLDDWNNKLEWQKVDEGLEIVEWNDPEGMHETDPIRSQADIYAPTIVQEFTYMTLDKFMPVMVRTGSEILIPMAHDPYNPYRGLNSFDTDGDGDRDPLRVESEDSINVDIDGNGVMENMNLNGAIMDNDESVVLVLGNMRMDKGDTIQMFDQKITLKDVFADPGLTAQFDVCDNEGGNPNCASDVQFEPDDVKTFYRGIEVNDRGTLYVRLISADASTDSAIVEVGRLFGEVDANIGQNIYWNQKAFMVDSVFYSVSAIMTSTDGNCFKYMTIRQKLPKFDVKIFGKHLEVWKPDEILPEMSPFNQPHEIIVDVLSTQDIPENQLEKVGTKVPSPPLVITYVKEDIEDRYTGSLLEILSEPYVDGNNCPDDYESWVVEWYHTYPEQYTEFKLPKGQKYLVTLGWEAPESENTIWNDDSSQPLDTISGDRIKFWYEDCTGPLYIDNLTNSIRIYGTFGEGAGDASVGNENWPYTNPEAPFFPQHPQSPRKDFMTFNPAMMDHNQAPPGSNDYYDELDFTLCEDSTQAERPMEKVFKTMWYEKEWFKDSNLNGVWDVVVLRHGTPEVRTLDWWNNKPEWEKVNEGLEIVEHNDPEGMHETDPIRSDADIYAPTIVQEFTYMTLDKFMPVMVETGSEILIPMAHDPNDQDYRGLNSFDADGDGDRDPLRVESEFTIDVDIDGNGVKETLNPNGLIMDNDESVVLVLGNMRMDKGDTIQMFDQKITLNDVWGTPGLTAQFDVCTNEGGNSNCEEDVELAIGEVSTFYRGNEVASKGTLYLKLISGDASSDTAIVEVGRLFGEVDANIGQNIYWNQKAFMVDGVFYSVSAIMTSTDGECFKYITIRQKLPKSDVKIFGKHLLVWNPGEILPEMSPFNQPHEVIVDVLSTQNIPQHQLEKVGEKVPRPPLEITYVAESIEPRFEGSLLEILHEDYNNGAESWVVEWFHTYPEQYTAFVVPEGELYLMTLAWHAPEAETTIWDGNPYWPIANYTEDRAKFWYDPADPTDIYVNRIDAGVEPDEPDPIDEWDTSGNGVIEKAELKVAILSYLQTPIGTVPTRDDLKILILDYLANL